MKQRFLPLFGLLTFLLSACQPVQAPAGAQAAAPAELILATTTSTQDSGLLDAILPVFEADAQASVGVVAVGTGQALQEHRRQVRAQERPTGAGVQGAAFPTGTRRVAGDVAARHGSNRSATMWTPGLVEQGPAAGRGALPPFSEPL